MHNARLLIPSFALIFMSSTILLSGCSPSADPVAAPPPHGATAKAPPPAAPASPAPAAAKPPSPSAECASEEEVKAQAGAAGHAYVRKASWEQLIALKEWAKADTVTRNEIEAVWTDSQTYPPGGSIAWRRGEPVCIRFEEGVLWAKALTSKLLPIGDWQGPFIDLGENGNIANVYFDAIFRKNCFRSETGEKWCFDNSTIHIDGKKRGAKLLITRTGMPSRGNTLAIDGGATHWTFVPEGKGWKVFESADLSQMETALNIGKPLRTLTATP